MVCNLLRFFFTQHNSLAIYPSFLCISNSLLDVDIPNDVVTIPAKSPPP